MTHQPRGTPLLKGCPKLITQLMLVLFITCLLPCVLAQATFVVSPSEMTQAEGNSYCSGRGMTLAAIYNTDELSTARNAISAAGVTKAITSATSDGNGWRWGSGGARWVEAVPVPAARLLSHESFAQMSFDTRPAGGAGANAAGLYPSFGKPATSPSRGTLD